MHKTKLICSRKALRLSEYDYQLRGFYYVTLCTQNRLCLFGHVKNEEMLLNDSGQMINNVWIDIPEKYPGCEIDSFIIMPNHLHGILIINEITAPDPRLSLPNIIRNYKSFTTNSYIRGIEENKFEPFEKRLWQRSYYEHIIRKDNSLKKIREYIRDNPRKWNEDKENPIF